MDRIIPLGTMGSVRVIHPRSPRTFTAFVATTAYGLYASTNFTFGAGAPVWTHLGQQMGIDVFDVYRPEPAAMQMGISGGDVYLRRPAAYGDGDWHSILTDAAAETLRGGATTLAWVAVSSVNAGHLYVLGGQNATNTCCFYSRNYGASWSVVTVAKVCRYGGGVWVGHVNQGDDVLYVATNVSSGGSGRVYYSVTGGASWVLKHGDSSSIWCGRVMVDPNNNAVSYFGGSINGPTLKKATTISGGYTECDGAYSAGVSLIGVSAMGWINPANSNQVRTVRSGVLYYSNDAASTWGTKSGAPGNGALWGMGSAGLVAGSTGSQVLQATDDLGDNWYDKLGNIPGAAGAIANQGIYVV